MSLQGGRQTQPCPEQGEVGTLRAVLEYAQIAFGAALSAAAINLFILPHHFASGGFSGLLIIAHYLWNTPIGLLYALCNVPLVLWLWRIQGWEGLAKTVWGIALFSGLIDAFAFLQHFYPTHDPILAIVYAAVLGGVGGGLIYRTGATSGGTSLAGRILRHYTGFEIGRFMFLTDLLVMGLAGLVLGAMEITLYSWVLSYLSNRIVDSVQEGLVEFKACHIISDQGERIAEALMAKLHRGVTELTAQGGFTHRQRTMLVCVVAPQELVRLRNIVQAIDPEAFLFVTAAREVAGRGFTLDSAHRRVPFWAKQRA